MIKNKVVINILIAYFALLTIVLVIQLPKKNITAKEPIASDLQYEEKLKNAVVLYVGSPIAVINESQIIIDEDDASVTPEVVNGKTYIPVSVLKTAFGAAISWNKQNKETTIRYNNTAIIFKNESNSIRVVDMNGDTKQEIETAPLILHNRAYIPLRIAVDIFEKEVFYNNNLIIISEIKDIFDPTTEINTLSLLTEQVNSLPTVGSEDKLKALIEKTVHFGDSNEQQDALSALSFSETNNQDEGVNEADIIKTDGEYIYYVRNSSVEIVNAADPQNMESASKIKFENDFEPKAIYVEGKKLVVMGNCPYFQQTDEVSDFEHSQIYIYGLEDISAPLLLRKIDADGAYFNSRLIKNDLYFISSIKASEINTENGRKLLPLSYCDSAVGDKRIYTGFENTKYFPDVSGDNYICIISLDISENGSPAEVDAYFGAGDNIYVSENNLYFACRSYTASDELTNIYRFRLEDGRVVYSKRTNVDGFVLNQFSMDEKNGFFRIATTKRQITTGAQSSNLFVFNPELEKCGEIKNIAPGEKIYSARFLGDRAYMVTYESVDPLFAIDLKNPNKPEILGSLKIPGYSSYLHPYDENHLIGLGKDSVVYANQPYYLGLKLAMFDVSDVSNPKELFSESVGDRGTESAALYDHKAFLFNKDKNVLSIPIDLYVKDKEDDENPTQYGKLSYQGAYVYSIDMDKGFVLNGRVTHFMPDYSFENGMDENYAVKRIIYIGDNLFTASNSKIEASSLKSFDVIGEIKFSDENSEISSDESSESSES